jgi:hypothetical protein
MILIDVKFRLSPTAEITSSISNAAGGENL